MIKTSFAIAVLVSVLPICGEAMAQAKDEVQRKLADFKKLIRVKKGTKDAAAIAILDELLTKYPKMVSADQKRFVRGVADCLTAKKVTREPGKGDELFRRAVRALGATGVRGSKHLRGAYEGNVNRKFKGRPWVSLRGDILEQLGVGKDPSSVPLLLKQIRSRDEDTLRSKAGAALRHFEAADLKTRKQIGKMMIREWINIHSNAHGTTEPGLAQQRARSEQRLLKVSGPWNVTLGKLTKQKKYDTPQKWQDFYNSPDWDKNWDKMAMASSGKKSKRKKRRK